MILLFPYSMDLYYKNAKLISGRNFKQVTYVKASGDVEEGEDTDVAASILAVKLIPESILSSSGLNGDILSSDISAGRGWANVASNPSIGAFYTGSELTNGVAYLKSTKSEIDLSLNATMGSIYNREPFKSYEL